MKLPSSALGNVEIYKRSDGFVGPNVPSSESFEAQKMIIGTALYNLSIILSIKNTNHLVYEMSQNTEKCASKPKPFDVSDQQSKTTFSLWY